MKLPEPINDRIVHEAMMIADGQSQCDVCGKWWKDETFQNDSDVCPDCEEKR